MLDCRVLTLNIHKGFAMGGWTFTLERIRQCLRKTESSIVFLQEVIGENSRHRDNISNWPETNQFEFLADSVWEHYAYGKNAIHQYGHHGNAILSEIPFRELNNLNVSTHSFSQRGVLHGWLENGIHVLCIHLGLIERERASQLALLYEYIAAAIPDSAPLIIAGDFNDWRKKLHDGFCSELSLVEVHQQHEGKLAKTFPAAFPLLPMDRIYCRGFSVLGVSNMADSSWRDISDHRALMADLRLMESVGDHGRRVSR